MPQAAIAADVHKPLDIARDLAAKVALHLVVLLELLADLVDLIGGKIVNSALPVDPGGVQDLQGSGTANPVGVSILSISI